MKLKLNKILSVVLTIALVISCMTVSTLGVSAAEVIYYIKNGGEGNGLSYDSPMGSVADVVADINTKGYGADTTVIIKVIHNDNWNSYDSTTKKHGMAYWAEGGGAVEPHTANLIIEAYDSSVKTYLAYSAFFIDHTNYSMALNGPTTFDNITIVEMRYRETPMTLGSNVTFGSGVEFAFNQSYVAPTGTTFSLASGTLGTTIASADKLDFTEDVNITINNAYASNPANAGEQGKTGLRIGTGSYNDVTFAGNINITVNNAEASPVINFSNGSGGGSVTANKSININIKNATNVYLENTNYYWDGDANVSGTGRPLTADALQVIVSGGTLNNNIKDDADLTFTNGSYYLNNISGDSDLISFTNTVGEYNIKSGVIAVATNESEEQFFSVDGVLSLPKMGEYEINVYTPPKTEDYYVQYGGTGDGLSPESPVATVADAVKLINAANFGAGDTATVYIMQSESRDLNKTAGTYTIGASEGCLTHGYTAWSDTGAVDEYSAKLIIKPYTTDSITYLAFSKYAGANTNMSISGPCEFENIAILSNRSVYNKIYLKGNNVEFGTGTTFAAFNGSATAGVGNPSNNKHDIDIFSSYYDGVKTYSEDVNIAFKNNLAYNNNRSFRLGSWAGHYTYSGNILFTYDYSEYDTKNDCPIYLNNGHTNSPSDTINKNLNFYVLSANKLIIAPGNGNKSVTVNGGLQFIYVDGASIVDTTGAEFTLASVPKTTVKGGEWYIKNATGNKEMLSYTDVAGTYKVIAGHEVKAVDSDGNEYFSKNGFIILPAGAYTVTEYFPPQTVEYYVKNGESGDGRTAATPAGSVEAVIASVNEDLTSAEDNATIYIMKRNDWNYQTAGIHNMAYWTDVASAVVPKHTAKITVRAYDVSTPTYLCFSSKLGQNHEMMLGGETVFEDITLVSPRYAETSISAHGYNVTFANTTKYAAFGSYSVPSNTEPATFSLNTNYKSLPTYTDAYSTGNTVTEDHNMVFENDFQSGSSVVIGGHYPTTTYQKDVNIVLDNSDIKAAVKIGLGHASAGKVTINGNINLNVKKAQSVSLSSNNRAISANAFQAIISSGSLNGSIADVTTLNLTSGNAFYLYNESGNVDLINFTNTAGTYTVPDGWEAKATNNDTQAVVTSDEGILTLTAGSWTITADKVPVTKTYYVQYGGNGDGRSQTAPAGNVAQAIASVNEELFNGDTANIKIMPSNNRELNVGEVYEKGGKLEHGYTAWADDGIVPQHSAKIIVEAINSDVTTYLAFCKYVGYNAALQMNGPTEFRNITLLSCRTIYRNIGHNGNSVTYGEGTKYAAMPHDASTRTDTWNGKIDSKSAYSTYFGASTTVTYPNDVDVVFNNAFGSTSMGDANSSIHLSADSGYANNTFSGNVKITVNNKDAAPNIYLHRNTVIGGDFTVDVKKAAAFTMYDVGGNLTVGGNVQVLIPYGTSYSGNLNTMENTKVTVSGGIWIVRVVTDVENALSLTDVPGTYTIASGYKAIAKNVITGVETEPMEGQLILEPNAQYEVSVVDNYYNNGETITVYKASSIDLNNEKHTNKDGKVFVGWKKNGSFAAQSATYNEGDVLTAEYIDFASSSFEIEGTELRTDEKVGIRYIIKQDKNAIGSLPNIASAEYGAIYLPTDTAAGREIRVDEPIVVTWKWDAVNKNDMSADKTGATPIKSLTPNILQESETELRYTICLTGDKLADNYSTFYTARAYIKYTDGNGITAFVYTADETTSAYKLASEETEKTEVHNTIISAVKAENEAYANSADVQYTESTVYTKDNPNGIIRNTDTSDSFGTLGNGTKKRVVTINTGLDVEQISVGWLSDIHLNYINKTDIEQALPNILAGYRGRSWLRGGEGLTTSVNTINYTTRMFDRTVVTGDIVDYLSNGSLLATRNLIAKKSVNNNILMSTGNHEFAETAQTDTPGLPNNYTLAQKYGFLQDSWAHDVYYHDEVVYKADGVTPNAHIVTIDNGLLAYADGTAEKLAATIAEAKKTNTPIFIFQHVPIQTGNPNETNVWFTGGQSLYFGTAENNNGGSINMVTTGGYCDAGKSADTAATLELIRKNSDIIKGVFNGHEHENMYTEIPAWDENGNVIEGKYIPQFTASASAYNWVNEIVIK